jgi:hypothetical protein
MLASALNARGKKILLQRVEEVHECANGKSKMWKCPKIEKHLCQHFCKKSAVIVTNQNV